MAKKNQQITPNSQIRAALRRLWLRSRERSYRLKSDGYSCQVCGSKQSKAKGREVKVEVHHKNGCEWDRVIAAVREYLLCDPDELETLCKECHDNLSSINNQLLWPDGEEFDYTP
jgi:5-methylcytosine-specific restriction endonuclease McrA